MESVSYFIAFSAGFLSFVSPCVLPVVPSLISYVTGLSLAEFASMERRSGLRQSAMINAILFILGFSTIFISLGASATLIGRTLISYQATIRQVGGLLIILFGLHILGLFKPLFLMRDIHFRFSHRPAGYFGSYLVGMAFGAGWTPCVGPILGSILLYASTTGSVVVGIQLLAVYSLGLGLPLFAAFWGVQSFLASSRKTIPYLRFVSGISGILLVTMGFLVSTNAMMRLTAFFYEMGIGWDIGQ